MSPCHHGWEGHHRDLTERGEFPHLLGQRHRDRGFSGKGNPSKNDGTRWAQSHQVPIGSMGLGIFTHHEWLICLGGVHVGKYIVRPMEILWVINFGPEIFL